MKRIFFIASLLVIAQSLMASLICPEMYKGRMNGCNGWSFYNDLSRVQLLTILRQSDAP